MFRANIYLRPYFVFWYLQNMTAILSLKFEYVIPVPYHFSPVTATDLTNWKLVIHSWFREFSHYWSRGHFKKSLKLFNMRALKFSTLYKNCMFQWWVRYVVLNFKGTLLRSENLRVPIFKSSWAFLLIHRGWKMICVSKLGHHWFR